MNPSALLCSTSRTALIAMFTVVCGIAKAAEKLPPRITWEEMEKREPSELWSETNVMNLYDRLDLDALTPEQTDMLKRRLKKIGRVPDGFRIVVRSREFKMLVKLRDDETVTWLLSQMGLGGGESADAGAILGESGEAWLLPQLERFVFWDPAAEPKIEMSDVIFASIAANAFHVCRKIVRLSPALTPKFKDWFEMLSELGWWEPPGSRREMLRTWWNNNRERMAAGNFRSLSMIPLWKGQPTESTTEQDHFQRADFFAALKSEFPRVRCLALERIKKQWAADLTDNELRHIADILPKPVDYVRQLAANLLASRGGDGVAFLKKALGEPDAEVRACASMALLDHTNPSDVERKQYLKAIVESLGYEAETSRGCVGSNYLLQHPQLKDDVMPLLKERVLDKSLPDAARTVTAYQLGGWATKDDLPFLEDLLNPSFPAGVRGWTVHAVCRLYPIGEPPKSIRKLADDPSVGPLIKDYHYLEKPSR